MATIMIVDDAAFMRGSLKFIVEDAGHTVVALAKNGQEAVELYTKLKPDIVTMDVLMPDMDGLHALKAIRSHDQTAKVVMVTALGQEDKQQEASKLGACGYIRKPFKREQVADEIERLLGDSRR